MAANAVSPEPRRAAGFLRSAITFYNDVIGEMRKVTWPDRTQVRQATIAIIIFVLVIGAVIFLLDVVLQGVLVRLIPALFTRG
ncbi:MAG: preprotein translocase subunit SecE [Gemmatimonadaceae bacterium]